MSAALTTGERLDLTALKTVVREGLATFIQVGQALAEIRDRRLYRDSHATFAEYCHDRWLLSRTRAYQLIDAAAVSTTVDIAGLPAPANETQARQLAPLMREDEREAVEVWRELRARHGGSVTAEKVRSAVSDRLRLDGRVRVMASSLSAEWYTPAQYVEAAREVLGGIDLDPASCAEANRTVQAARYHAQDDAASTPTGRARSSSTRPMGRSLAGSSPSCSQTTTRRVCPRRCCC